MRYTSLLALSSPEGESNYFSELLRLTNDDGSLFFQVVDCFQICERCQKLERSKAIQCTHIKNNAHWLSSSSIRKLKALYKNNPEDAMREFGGMVVSDYAPAFAKEEVARWFSRPRWVQDYCPPYIFITADPNGGGPSHFSIVSGFYNGLDCVVSYSCVSTVLFFLSLSLSHFMAYANSAFITKSRIHMTTLSILTGCFLRLSVIMRT
jgi:hypothetical protein